MECKYCKSNMEYNENFQRFECKNCESFYYDFSELKETDPIFLKLLNIDSHKIIGQWYRGDV